MERLQKFMARCGIASRRKCEEIILSGKVKVNDEVVNELGAKIDPLRDTVIVNDKLIKPEEKKLYIALNKPEGYLSTVKDDRGRKTLLDLVKVDERIYPIGRLDYDTSGLILLTNDGDIYNNIMHPRVEKNKRYIAVIKGCPDESKLNKFKSGIDIGGYITAPSDIKVLKMENNNTEVLITIHEGKNRQIRKMCEKIGHPVLKLKRVAIGNIKLDNLEKGHWRFLTDDEVKYLKE